VRRGNLFDGSSLPQAQPRCLLAPPNHNVVELGVKLRSGPMFLASKFDLYDGTGGAPVRKPPPSTCVAHSVQFMQ